MPGQRDIFCDLVQLGRIDVRQRVFLRLEHTRLQRRWQFGKGQRRGIGAKRVEDRDGHVVRRGADLDALEVCRGGDRFRQMADMADAVVPEPQQLQPGGLRAFVDLALDVAVDRLPCAWRIREQKRQANDVELGNDLGRGALTVRGDLDHVGRGRGQRLDIIAHGRGAGDIDGDPALGAGGHLFSEEIGRHRARIARRLRMGQDDFVGAGDAAKSDAAEDGSKNCGFHDGPPKE